MRQSVLMVGSSGRADRIRRDPDRRGASGVAGGDRACRRRSAAVLVRSSTAGVGCRTSDHQLRSAEGRTPSSRTSCWARAAGSASSPRSWRWTVVFRPRLHCWCRCFSRRATMGSCAAKFSSSPAKSSGTSPTATMVESSIAPPGPSLKLVEGAQAVRHLRHGGAGQHSGEFDERGWVERAEAAHFHGAAEFSSRRCRPSSRPRRARR